MSGERTAEEQVGDNDRLGGNADAGWTGQIANTHVHLPPNFSAFETVEQAAHLAAAEGVAVVGTSNYHDFGVYARFAAAAHEAGVVPTFGVEIIAQLDDPPAGGMLVNDPTNLNRMYVCGKGLTRFGSPTPEAARLMAAIRAASDDRIRTMTARVATRFAAVGLDGSTSDAQIAAAVALRCGVPVDWVALQERHVAQAFQEVLFERVAPAGRMAVLERLFEAPGRVGAVSLDPTDAVAVQEAIRSGLMKAGRPAFVPEAAGSFDDAYRLILELGGIPCYPILADGASPICTFEDPPEALAERILRRGIHCAELIPVRNRASTVDRYVAVLRGAGIIVLAGTEHNTRRMIPLAPTALGGEPLSDLSRAAFWEGTCVVVGHQASMAAGGPGYVDGDGRPAAEFATTEARIEAFRALGAGVVEARAARAATGAGASPASKALP